MQAIGSALVRGSGGARVTLIQGPPGTGKTAVIAGILAGILFNNPMKPPCNTPSTPAPATGQTLALGRIPTRRVLVCAQSNAAIDELLTRLSARGLATATGASRGLAMLRLGNIDATHAAALRFHIDYVVDAGASGGDPAASEGGSVGRKLRLQLLDVAQRIQALMSGPASGALVLASMCPAGVALQMLCSAAASRTAPRCWLSQALSVSIIPEGPALLCGALHATLNGMQAGRRYSSCTTSGTFSKGSFSSPARRRPRRQWRALAATPAAPRCEPPSSSSAP